MEPEPRARKEDRAPLWHSVPASRSFLRILVGLDEPKNAIGNAELDIVADWLAEAGLAALAYRRCEGPWEPLRDRVRGAYYVTAMNHTLHMQRLSTLSSAFAAAKIPFVLLKGVALSTTVYADHVRPMSDIDFWLRAEDMPVAIRAAEAEGFQVMDKATRPQALQQMADGELRLAAPDGALVELHWSPFSGWWLQRAAQVDKEALWQRVEPLPLGLDRDASSDATEWERVRLYAYMLCPEDTILHLAVHLAVNHQFGMWGIRSIVDVAMVMARRRVDWQALVARAHRWRLATVLWTVLNLEQQLIGTEDLGPVIGALQPPPWKQRLLARLINPPFLLGLENRGRHPLRLGLLLLLTDSTSDATRLILRALWPEREWLEARYGAEKASYRHHFWHMLRQKDI